MRCKILMATGLTCLLLLCSSSHAQMITGVWKGKAGSGLRTQRMELKLVQKGDSLVGTVYYHEGPGSYKRYAVSGYFDTRTNAVHWRDEALLAERNSRLLPGGSGNGPQAAVADFNCPGAGVMLLEGTLGNRELKLSKAERPQFRDEWDFIIENYLTGGNNPQLIDSVRRISMAPPATATPPVATSKKPAVATPPQPEPTTAQPDAANPPVAVNQPAPANQPPTQPTTPVATALPKTPTTAVVTLAPPAVTITPQPAGDGTTALIEKFKQRKQVPVIELPLAGDTLEVHFYDNAEIDGDSISVFLNGALIARHVRLSDKPFVLKWAIADLAENNELVMVAENLGSIPPNTSYMIAWINGQRYTAQLESTEQTSAMIRLLKTR